MELVSVNVERTDEGYARRLCEALERGNVLLLSPTPFIPSEENCEFLRAQKQTDGAKHKNIAYKPHLRRVTGADHTDQADVERMRRILQNYSEGALACLSELFPTYAKTWRVDYASFRPVEEQGRKLPLRQRNDLMHLDAFPTRPTYGGRILRTFTNIHPTRERIWGIARDFEELAEKYAVPAGLRKVSTPSAVMLRRASVVARLLGLRVPDRSAYDEFMLRFHHYLKSDAEFQRSGQVATAVFPPGSTWISFTDQVAHRVLAGQFALEQTCIVPYSAMVLPEKSPVAVLERIAGKPLVEAGRQALAAH